MYMLSNISSNLIRAMLPFCMNWLGKNISPNALVLQREVNGVVHNYATDNIIEIFVVEKLAITGSDIWCPNSTVDLFSQNVDSIQILSLYNTAAALT